MNTICNNLLQLPMNFYIKNNKNNNNNSNK